MKKLLTVLAALLVCGTAFADVHYWLSPTGSNSNTGGSPTAPWQTVAHFNANALQPNTANGNVILHLFPHAGGWPSAPQPTAVPANGKYFMVVGDSTLTTNLLQYKFPASTVLLTTHIIIKGCYFTGNVTIGGGATGSNAMGTRLWDCTIGGNLTFKAAVGAAVRRCLISGNVLAIGDNYLREWPAVRPTRRDTIESCRMPNLGLGNGGTTNAAWDQSAADSCLVIFNNARLTAPNPAHAFVMFESRWNRYYGNRFTVINNSSAENTFKVRNLCLANTWKRDTLIGTGSMETVFNLCELGGCHDTTDIAILPPQQDLCDTTGACRGTVVDSCYFHNSTGSGMTWQQGLDNNQITRNVFAGTKMAVDFIPPYSFARWNTIDHNTFVGAGRAVSQDGGVGGVVGMRGMRPKPVSATDTLTAPQLQISNNLFQATNLPLTESCDVEFGPDGAWSPGVSVEIPVETDTTETTFYRNLHSLNSYIETPGDKAWAWGFDGRNCCGVDLNSQDEFNFPAKDSLSVYGDALLVNPAVTAALDANGLPVDFNPRLQVASAAIDIGASSTDAGAIEFVSAPRLQITCSDSTKGLLLGPGDVDNAFFCFTNVGNDTLDIDTLFIWDGYSGTPPTQGSLTLGNGIIEYNGYAETRVPPGMTFIAIVKMRPTNVFPTTPPPTGLLIAPFYFGIIFDTNDPAYDWMSNNDPLYDPANSVGINFYWRIPGRDVPPTGQ